MYAPVGMILLLPLFFFTMTDQSVAAGKGQSLVRELDVGGMKRSYITYAPAEFQAEQLPLMIVLHGGLGNAAHMERTSGMNEIADAGGFIVAYPDGTGGLQASMRNRRTWNAGRCCGQAVRQKADDVSFIARMIDDVRSRYPIDAGRVYVAGHSNGAMLAYRLACEIPEKIAAIIAVSGTIAVDNCDRAKDIPVLHIHGEYDRNVPFRGGVGKHSLAGVPHRSVPESLELITRSRDCSGQEKTALNGGIQETSYICRSGAPVSLYLIRGGGHAWPGGRARTGPNSRGISAGKLAWEFAKQFSKHN